MRGKKRFTYNYIRYEAKDMMHKDNHQFSIIRWIQCNQEIRPLKNYVKKKYEKYVFTFSLGTAHGSFDFSKCSKAKQY